MKKLNRFIFVCIITFICIYIVPIVFSDIGYSYTVEAATRLNTYGKTLTKGSTYTLKLSGTSKKVKWSSSNKKVAIVNQNGKVTAVGKGTAFITAKTSNSRDVCKIVVKSTSKISISTKSKKMVKGTTYTLKIKGTSSKPKWSTSNKKVATVNSNGKVTAKGKGTATITATVKGKKYTCKIVVESPYLNIKNYTMLKGSTYTLKLKGTTQSVKWSSSNTKIATVNSNGKITAKSTGTVYIKAKVGGKTYSCKVLVESPYFSSKNYSVNTAASIKVALKGTTKKVTYKSEDTSIAKVDANGKVYGIKTGKTTITANVYGKKYTYTINVKTVSTLSGWKTIYGSKYYYEEGIPATGLKSINDRNYYFNDSGVLTSKFGIDVSVHQGTIDWEKAKADGVEFAILRCGYGMDQEDQDDEQFKRNIQQCKKLGIPFGVYLYSYANTIEKAKSEADHVIRLVKGYEPELGIWYDVEDKIQSKLEKELLTDIINTFCNKIKKKGYSVGIYSSKYWLTTKIDSSITKKYPVWVAQYYHTCEYEGEYVIWQYTSSGKVDGISTRVDFNIMY